MLSASGVRAKPEWDLLWQSLGGATIPIEVLQRAFQNIYDTMDNIDTFKAKALASMKQTVTTLTSEVEKSKGYIARAEGAAQAKHASDAPSLLSLEG